MMRVARGSSLVPFPFAPLQCRQTDPWFGFRPLAFRPEQDGPLHRSRHGAAHHAVQPVVVRLRGPDFPFIHGAPPALRPHPIFRRQVVRQQSVRLPLFDPSRSTLATFIARVTESALIDAARRMAADKRNPDREPPTPDQQSFDPAAVAEVLDGPGRERKQDLQMDLQELLSALPQPVRQLLDDVGQYGVAEAAQRHGVYPGTVHRRLQEFRQRREGLRGYVDP